MKSKINVILDTYRRQRLKNLGSQNRGDGKRQNTGILDNRIANTRKDISTSIHQGSIDTLRSHYINYQLIAEAVIYHSARELQLPVKVCNLDLYLSKYNADIHFITGVIGFGITIKECRETPAQLILPTNTFDPMLGNLIGLETNTKEYNPLKLLQSIINEPENNNNPHEVLEILSKCLPQINKEVIQPHPN